MIVRQAEISDYQAMIGLVEEFFKANSFTHLEVDIDIESVAKLVEKLTKEHLILVLETDNKEIVGGIGGIIMPFLFNTKIKMFQEIFFYVQDGFRKYSQLLLAELKKACKELKLNRIIMAHINDGTLKEMERFYKARGFKKLEIHFIARI